MTLSELNNFSFNLWLHINWDFFFCSPPFLKQNTRICNLYTPGGAGWCWVPFPFILLNININVIFITTICSAFIFTWLFVCCYSFGSWLLKSDLFEHFSVLSIWSLEMFFFPYHFTSSWLNWLLTPVNINIRSYIYCYHFLYVFFYLGGVVVGLNSLIFDLTLNENECT